MNEGCFSVKHQGLNVYQQYSVLAEAMGDIIIKNIPKQ